MMSSIPFRLQDTQAALKIIGNGYEVASEPKKLLPNETEAQRDARLDALKQLYEQSFKGKTHSRYFR